MDLLPSLITRRSLQKRQRLFAQHCRSHYHCHHQPNDHGLARLAKIPPVEFGERGLTAPPSFIAAASL